LFHTEPEAVCNFYRLRKERTVREKLGRQRHALCQMDHSNRKFVVKAAATKHANPQPQCLDIEAKQVSEEDCTVYESISTGVAEQHAIRPDRFIGGTGGNGLGAVTIK